jgi:predicted GIY-YIG superfamily endonuclease
MSLPRIPPTNLYRRELGRWHRRRMAWVYILRCSDNSLYVGSTSDIDERERAHTEGRNGSYTAARRPVRLVYQEEFRTLAGARKREQQIKRWSGRKKMALIAGDWATLKSLSRSHQRR